MSTTHRRRGLRLPIEPITHARVMKSNMLIVADSLDFNTLGMRVQTNQPLQLAEPVVVQVTIPDIDRILLRGAVVWSKAADRTTERFQSGIQFQSGSLALNIDLLLFYHKLLDELKKRSIMKVRNVLGGLGKTLEHSHWVTLRNAYLH